jgi:hypothetical protein
VSTGATRELLAAYGLAHRGLAVAIWRVIFDGWIVPATLVDEMIRPRSEVSASEARYGLGFWLHPSRSIVELHGYDAGVSFRSVHDRPAGLTHTAIANTSEGAWPISEYLDEALIG